ncbi:MAG: hypothetical protein KGJ02_04190 [Verrucomicrobiota bacterium]|nr:hypothetical protein [Verrucomicrobiota bacterium]
MQNCKKIFSSFYFCILHSAFCVLLSSCGSSSNWRYDSIANQESPYSSSRLLYNDPTSHLKLELLKIGDQLQAFVFLNIHRFRPSPNQMVEVTLSIDDHTFREAAPCREGKMRLLLPPSLTEQLILALQEGKPVGILIDGFQGTISPDQFADFYSKLLNGEGEWMNYIKLKGPFQ